jgi:hypothetical protein
MTLADVGDLTHVEFDAFVDYMVDFYKSQESDWPVDKS